VIDGMDVVERIGNVATGAHGPMKETPIKPVVILKIERVGGPSNGTAPKP
jgi:cyclophilin family peptidyl-prolyl cis-trans isomerase